jgi:hypothetical protein
MPRAAATWPCGRLRVRVKASYSGRYEGAALEHAAQAFDVGRGPAGEVAQRPFADFALVAKALAQEYGGRRVPVRDGFDIHD